MEPKNLQDLQDLIISSNFQESENKTWSIPVQILIDQYETSQDNDVLCSGKFILNLSYIINNDDNLCSAQKHIRNFFYLSYKTAWKLSIS